MKKTSNTNTNKFQQAIILHQQGQLEQAQSLYKSILKTQPLHAESLHFLGVIASQRGKHQLAINLINKSIKIMPTNAAAYLNIGRAFKFLARFDESLASFDHALTIKPDYVLAHHNRGIVLSELKRYNEALDCYNRALLINPDDIDTLFSHGFLLQKLERFSESLISYDRILRINPECADALSNRGSVLKNLKRFNESLISYDLALQINPECVETLTNRGNVLQELKHFDESLSSYDSALKIDPECAEALTNRGNLLQGLKRYNEALFSYELALKTKPDHIMALYKRSRLLQELKYYDEALVSYDRILIIKPDYAEAIYNRGNIFKDLKRYDEAIDCYNSALKIEMNFVEALCNLGIILRDLKRYAEALSSYDRALIINPEFAEAHINRGNVLYDLHRLEEALVSYNSALNINPEYATAFVLRGNVYKELNRYDEALLSYGRALDINPNYEFVLGNWMFMKMKICDWSNFKSNLNLLMEGAERDDKLYHPFSTMSLISSAALLKKVACCYVQTKYPKSFSSIPILKRDHAKKIKIGYFSADFRNHAVAYLIAGLFELHDKSRFQIIAFSFMSTSYKDEMLLRLQNTFDQFIEVSAQSDQQLVSIARQLEIDIAIDLMGFTKHSRTGIFAMRAAPVQISYLGYPGTMSANYIDYLIADTVLIPTQYQHYYTEKIIYLPNSYQANDSKRLIADRTFSRIQFGLPEQGFVFCCFNNNNKITPTVFDSWMRILHEVEGSVLWLMHDNFTAAENLRKEAEARGIKPARLVFAQHVNMPEHLARHRLADLFLDTTPFNAHTTASDSLWAGLPVLTCIGETFAGRVAASLLNAIGLPELVTKNKEEYETLAIQIATHPEQLAMLNQKLSNNRSFYPLFNTKLFAQHIELAFQIIFDRYQSGLAPEHIYVN